jgi:hypothetical protein
MGRRRKKEKEKKEVKRRIKVIATNRSDIK